MFILPKIRSGPKMKLKNSLPFLIETNGMPNSKELIVGDPAVKFRRGERSKEISL